MIKTVIFDFDGTIADTFKAAVETINALAGKYGFKEIEAGEIEEFRAQGIQGLIKKRHLSILKLPKMLKDYTTLFQSKIPLQQPIKQIPQLLNELNQNGYDLNIITSNSVENVSLFLNKHKLTCFKHIDSDQSLFGKDKVIANFLKKYQIKNEEAIYVGDEVRDIEAAHKAKIKIMAVTWGFNYEEVLKQNSPDYLVNQPKQIAEVLEKINTH